MALGLGESGKDKGYKHACVFMFYMCVVCVCARKST
jgi:hypothetical protein